MVVFILKFVDNVFYIFGPLRRSAALVECLVRNRLAESNLVCFVAVLHHLVGKEEHCKVELYAEHLADVSQIVEEIRVLPLEVDWNNIALSLDALYHECLLPLQVADYAILLARA